MHNYSHHSAHDALPPGRVRSRIEKLGLVYSVFAQILPQLDHGPVFNAINFQLNAVRGVGGPKNDTARRTRIAVLLCPSDTSSPSDAPDQAPNYQIALPTPNSRKTAVTARRSVIAVQARSALVCSASSSIWSSLIHLP